MSEQTYSQLPSQEQIDEALNWLLAVGLVVYVVQYGNFRLPDAVYPGDVARTLGVLRCCDPAELPVGLSFELDPTYAPGVVGVISYMEENNG